jgi:hypothetical protein
LISAVPLPAPAVVKKLILAALLAVGSFNLLNQRFVLVAPLSAERAATERAAIERDLQREMGTLCVIASSRARAGRADLAERTVVCGIANSDIQFTREDRAAWTLTYTCGIAPWRRGHTPSVASPVIKLDVLKEHGTWTINAL